jgi:hypothetical protein
VERGCKSLFLIVIILVWIGVSVTRADLMDGGRVQLTYAVSDLELLPGGA